MNQRRHQATASVLLRAMWLSCALFLTSTAVVAQITSVPITVLQHVNVIDGNGGVPRHDATVVIHGTKIRSVTSGHLALPAGAKTIDLSGKTIMPELINVHGHLGLLRGTKTAAANYTEDNVKRQLLQYQEYGVGAVLVMGRDRDEAYGWRAQSHEGTLPGALLYTAGRGFGVPQGLPPATMGADEIYRPATPEEARSDVRELARHHPDVVKMWVDDFYGQYPKMKPEIYGAIIDEAHKQHLRVAAHLYHEEDAQRLVDDGVDIFAHSVRDAEIPDSLIAEMKRKHVSYIGTLALDQFAIAYADDPSWLGQQFFRRSLEPGVYEMITSEAYKHTVAAAQSTQKEQTALPIALRNIKRAYDAGIPVALGTDSGATPVRPYGFSEHMELQLLVRAGLTPLQAITVGTKNGARLLGAEDEIDTLTPGHEASFIVLDKDPSADIRNTETISAVWKAGKQVSAGPLAVAAAPQK
ncbi:MAG TPA: amidohydrolase family protein [Acidobacteriaceae bacterium]